MKAHLLLLCAISPIALACEAHSTKATRPHAPTHTTATLHAQPSTQKPCTPTTAPTAPTQKPTEKAREPRRPARPNYLLM